MSFYLWAIPIALVVFFFYLNKNKEKKEQYFRQVMAILQEKDLPSHLLLEKLTPTESGKILLKCFKQGIAADQAAHILLEKYYTV